jgi:4-amino-4-deoxy-L-arabinose transferase-like glycosyltransferase
VTDVQAPERPAETPEPSPAPRRRPSGPFLRRHAGIVVVVAAAASLRVLAEVAIYPGLWFSDGNNYAYAAGVGRLSTVRVQGYALFLAPFWHWFHSAGLLTISQHLLALGMVVVLYALLVRRGVPRWLATIAVIPAALDAYLIAIEHAIMADTLFHACVVAAIALLLWKDRPGLAAAAAAGLLLGYAGVVRSVGAPFFAVFVVYMLIRRPGWRTLVIFCVGFALVNAGYLTMFHAEHGSWSYTSYGARFLYARVATFADCSKIPNLPANERPLCPDPRHRLTDNGYLWGRVLSPIAHLQVSDNPRIKDFALRVIRAQPVTYATSIGLKVAHYFEPGHRVGRDDYGPQVWEFPRDPRVWGYPGYRGPIRQGHYPRKSAIDPNTYVTPLVRAGPVVRVLPSKVLHYYQRWAWTSGQILLICVAIVLAALVLRRGAWRLRLDAALLVSATLVSLIVASTLSVFSYRYGLLAILLLPPAAALAVTSMLRRQPSRSDRAQTS